MYSLYTIHRGCKTSWLKCKIAAVRCFNITWVMDRGMLNWSSQHQAQVNLCINDVYAWLYILGVVACIHSACIQPPHWTMQPCIWLYGCFQNPHQAPHPCTSLYMCCICCTGSPLKKRVIFVFIIVNTCLHVCTFNHIKVGHDINHILTSEDMSLGPRMCEFSQRIFPVKHLCPLFKNDESVCQRTMYYTGRVYGV